MPFFQLLANGSILVENSRIHFLSAQSTPAFRSKKHTRVELSCRTCDTQRIVHREISRQEKSRHVVSVVSTFTEAAPCENFVLFPRECDVIALTCEDKQPHGESKRVTDRQANVWWKCSCSGFIVRGERPRP